MKRTNIKSFLFGITVLFTFSACESWLDATPKSQIKEEDHFSREIGYKDQLTGVYSAMCSESMYGLQMGIGFTEILSQNYNVDGNNQTWRYAADYDYKNSACESIINNIWSNTYNCIANLNVLLKNIEKADPNMFEENHYALYKGEALGLRAFLHLDLMRLFACAPAMDNQAKGVPYVTEYSTNVVQQKTVGETMQLIVKDLLEARDYLSEDSLKIGSSPYYERAQRTCYFNYYACVATLARAYLWMQDIQNAQIYAKEIVDILEDESLYSTPFSWIHETTMSQAEKLARDRAFTCEHLFNLKIEKWEDTSNNYLITKAGTQLLAPSEDKAEEIFETSSGYGNDYRYADGQGFEQDGERRLPYKFRYQEGSNYNNIYPLIRMTEAVYILAECVKDSNPKRAVELLNMVRDNRHLSLYPLSEDLTPDQIQNEIYKEYRKEFLQEGQLFYYYKRLNANEIKGASVRPNRSIYVLPIPSVDTDFGGYEN